MKVECVGKSFIYRWPGGEVTLRPGEPIELPDERANRLLRKAGTRARMVRPTIQRGDRITWTRADTTRHTGLVEFIQVDETGIHWAFVTIGDSWAAVNLKFVTVPSTEGTLK